VNTVVCSLNKNEEMVSGIMKLPLTQWKILRCQKNARNMSMTISDDEFEIFCNRNVGFKGTIIENDMHNTYIIINPQGDLVFNSGLTYTKCGSVLTDNIDELLDKYPLRIDEYNKREKKTNNTNYWFHINNGGNNVEKYPASLKKYKSTSSFAKK
jgi:hypothetical protein